MKLLTVLLNYKTPDMTVRAAEHALRELSGIDGVHLEIVDNDSQDGSFEKLQQAVAEKRAEEGSAEGWGRVTVTHSGRNGGFGYGNNFAMRRALESEHPPDYFYILNSDAFCDPGAIQILVDYLESHSDVGIVGSYLHGPDGDSHVSAFRFHTLTSEIEGTIRLGVVTKLLRGSVVPIGVPDEATEVDWLAGASMMIRREVLEDVGFFDETFFLYFEETDLCLRAKRAGWKTVYVRESSVTHIGGASTGIKERSGRRVPEYWFESRRHFFKKNYGDTYLLAANVAHATGFALFRVRQRLLRMEDADPPKFLRDFVRHNFAPRRS